MGLPFNPIPKPSHKRNKPTARQRGDIPTKVRVQLRDRSGGVCEKCYSKIGSEAAHSIRRWKVKDSTTVLDVIHLCLTCHDWADETRAGRLFLKQFRLARYQAAGAAYYD